MTQAHASPPLPHHPILSNHTASDSSSGGGYGRVFVFGIAGFGGFEVSEVAHAFAAVADNACFRHDPFHARRDGGGPGGDLGPDGGAFGVADEFSGVLDPLLRGFDVEVLWGGEGGRGRVDG
jgi:hypothetical protein